MKEGPCDSKPSLLNGKLNVWWPKGQKFRNHSLRSSPTSTHKLCAAEFCLYLSLILTPQGLFEAYKKKEVMERCDAV